MGACNSSRAVHPLFGTDDPLQSHGSDVSQSKRVRFIVETPLPDAEEAEDGSVASSYIVVTPRGTELDEDVESVVSEHSFYSSSLGSSPRSRAGSSLSPPVSPRDSESKLAPPGVDSPSKPKPAKKALRTSENLERLRSMARSEGSLGVSESKHSGSPSKRPSLVGGTRSERSLSDSGSRSRQTLPPVAATPTKKGTQASAVVDKPMKRKKRKTKSKSSAGTASAAPRRGLPAPL